MKTIFGEYVKKHIDHIELVLDYVLGSEEEDFDENPSDNHVYYHAYAAWYGDEEAKQMLKETLEKTNETAS